MAFDRARIQVGRRCRQGVEILKTEGIGGVATRARTAAARWLEPTNPILEVRRADVIAADLAHPVQPVFRKVPCGRPMTVNWVITPPGPGSGGHTTLFRIINYLQAHGYRNRVYFYDVYRGDHQYYASIVRDYYGFDGAVATVDMGMADADAVVATAWSTAYPVYNSRCTGKRFYFIQDFEPFFYPAGSMSLLAENTYRMGFHGITIGQCFADKLRTEYGMVVDSFGYGSDGAQYRRLGDTRRSGVVFYARPRTPRRGFELGMMALELLGARRPDVDIHIYGHRMGSLPFRFHDHGHVTPAQLNDIYNCCYAGLSLSFTNVTLVALEMLGAGCIPVVNESAQIRTDVASSFVRYVQPHPHALADALEQVVKTPDFDSLSRAAAASVRHHSWSDAGARVDEMLRNALGASQREGSGGGADR